MKLILIISLVVSYLTNFSQIGTSGYVLQNSDGSIRINDSSISAEKVKGLNQWLSRNIKTINNTTIWGSGNVDVSAGATAWGGISGSIANQTDLSNILNAKQNSLGFTPYNATNPNGYISGITGGMVTTALGFTPLATNGNGSSLTGITKAQVGLSNADNTSDAAKPISTATQTALNLKQTIPSTGQGLGGTVTQATNKTTGVTINKQYGQITMSNAALAAAAEVSFTVTNSTVVSTDVIIVNIQSVGTAGSYFVTVGAVGNGSFSITVGNVSTGSLSQAIVLNFAVIKSVVN